jgi:hypothetical protein
MEYGACGGPDDDDEYCEQESNRPPRLMGGSSRDVGEDVEISDIREKCLARAKKAGNGAQKNANKKARAAINKTV